MPAALQLDAIVIAACLDAAFWPRRAWNCIGKVFNQEPVTADTAPNTCFDDAECAKANIDAGISSS